MQLADPGMGPTDHPTEPIPPPLLTKEDVSAPAGHCGGCMSIPEAAEASLGSLERVRNAGSRALPQTS